MLRRSILVSNSKGGVGKTSLTAHLAGLAAEANYRVLAVDLDPQGNLGRDLNYLGSDGDDRGQGLLEAIQFGREVTPIRDVRPGLDVVCGGPFVEDATKLETNFSKRGRDPHLVLEQALAPIAGQYHLIVIDSPPGDRYLQMIGLCAAQYVIVPTRSDEASLDGLNGLADAFVQARETNPALELLGVVLFGIGASATVIQREVRAKIAAGLGDVAPVFTAQIRYLEAPAVEARNRGMLVHEYERDLVAKAPRWIDRKRRGKHHAPPADLAVRVAPTAHKLAGDYAELATEFLNAVMSREQQLAAAGGAS